MPIYLYRCASCGSQNEHLQKISDPLLSVCPQCGKPEYKKQLTAAGFQLKGSGWYATDFKGGGAAKPADKSDSAGESTGDAADKKDAPAKDAPSKDSPDKKAPSKDAPAKDAPPAPSSPSGS